MNYKILAILSGLFISINLVFDSFNLKMIFDNIFIYAFLGGWIGVLLTFLITIFFGKKFDRNFKKIGMIPRKSFKYALLAGLFAAGYTFFLLYLIKVYDPSTVSALIPFTLIFLILRDFLYIKEKPTLGEISSFIMVFVGAILVSYNGTSFDWKVFLLAGIILNIINAFYSHFMKMGMSQKNTDAFNFRLFVTIVLAICFTFYTLPHLNFSSVNFFVDIPLVVGAMLFAFAGYICYLLALKNGKVSTVAGLNLSYVAFAFILTFILNLMFPHIFEMGFSNTLWIMKFLGIVLIMVAALNLLFSGLSSLLLFRIDHKNQEEISRRLLGMNEVKSMVHLFGKYSLGVTVNSRNEKDLRKIISEKILKIQGIEEIKIFNKR